MPTAPSRWNPVPRMGSNYLQIDQRQGAFRVKYPPIYGRPCDPKKAEINPKVTTLQWAPVLGLLTFHDPRTPDQIRSLHPWSGTEPEEARVWRVRGVQGWCQVGARWRLRQSRSLPRAGHRGNRLGVVLDPARGGGAAELTARFRPSEGTDNGVAVPGAPSPGSLAPARPLSPKLLSI